jgi:saccharopine dehydrogenase (NADP+, L-glutamate forming)
MNNILIIGAGRSATALINYILDNAAKYHWAVTVADADFELAQKKVGDRPFGKPAWLDATKPNDRKDLINRADVVVSLLPVHLHLEVAHDCISLKKHLITASYLSQEMYKLSDLARDKDLIFMNEMGLDPGIDHMSAMQKIHEIQSNGGKIKAFRSYTGGLVAPESDDNPWHYKFSWNPRNVVLAGQGTAQYLENDKLKYIPYNRLFESYHLIDVPGMGKYEAYPNRDSLLYRETYGLSGTPTILRGTLRHQGYCDAWNALVKIGLTDSSYPILNSQDLTYHGLMEAYVGDQHAGGTVKERIASLIGWDVDSHVMQKLEWLGLFRKKKIALVNASPSAIIEDLLLKKWAMKPDDKDMVIMQHEFEYEINRQKKTHTSTLVMKGENNRITAMSKLVGLPLGIFVKLVMLQKIKKVGVNIPVVREIYEPILEELKDYGLEFTHKES